MSLSSHTWFHIFTLYKIYNLDCTKYNCIIFTLHYCITRENIFVKLWVEVDSNVIINFQIYKLQVFITKLNIDITFVVCIYQHYLRNLLLFSIFYSF